MFAHKWFQALVFDISNSVYKVTGPLVWWLKYLLIVRETWVQSQVKSYQRLKEWYLMPPCLTLSIIRYGSRVGGAIQKKEYHPTLHFGVVAIEKRAFRVPLTTIGQFTIYKVFLFHTNNWLPTSRFQTINEYYYK